MLIFHKFPSKREATEFGDAVKARFDLKFSVHDSEESSSQLVVFPFHMTPPIVLVDRSEDFETEMTIIEQMIVEHGGEFAGT